MNENYTFRTEQVKHLPTEIYNRVWRWQYMLRKSIARFFKMKAYILRREITQPYLYTEQPYIYTEE